MNSALSIAGSIIRWVFVLVSLAMLTCYGQMDRGRITGIVTDSSGANVPGAVIRATNFASNSVVQTESDASGNFTLNLLLPGEYKIAAEKQGFKTFEQRGIDVHVNDVLTVNIPLELGAVSDKIEISAAAPLLEAATGALGSVIDSRRLRELPLFAGNPFMLEALVPGVSFVGNPQNTRPFDSSAAVMSVNGSQTYSTSFQLDGVPDNWKNAPAYTPSVEFIQEYKVETSAYDASLGHSESTFVDVALKSGTNQFHGSGFYFFQNPELNANVFFNNATGQPKPDYLFHRFGGGVGGPIRKDRVFFFAGVERIRENTPEPAFYTVPTAAERQGDFSALLSLGPSYQIYDPATTVPAANGQFSRQPFPGNIIPKDRIDPIGAKMMSYYPLPNTPGQAGGVNNFNFGQGMEPDHYYSVSGRIDGNISDKQRVFGHFVTSKRFDGPYRNFAPGASGNNLIYLPTGAAIDYVDTISPVTVVDFRYGFTRFTSTHVLSSSGFSVTTLGMPASLAAQLDPAAGFPLVQPSGYASLNSEGGGDYDHATIHFFYGSVSRTAGSHSLRAGADFRVYQDNAFSRGYANGQFGFGGYTNGPLSSSAAAPLGQGAAGLLLGVVSSGADIRNPDYAATNRYASIFFQDDWKVTRKLTLNLGLRWEYEGPSTERYNRLIRGFASDAASPIAAQAMANYAAAPIPQIPPSQFKVNGGLLFAGVNGQPRGQYDALAHEFSPRVGMAYSLTPRTVLRGGYGIFFGQVGITTQPLIQEGYSATTTLVPTLDNGITFIANLQNPFPNGIAAPLGSALGLSTYLGTTASFVNPHPLAPYTQRWSFGVQRELTRNLMMEVNYVGSHDIHLLAPGWSQQSSSLTGQQIDGIPNQYLSTLRTRDNATINLLSQAVPNPFYNLLPGTTMNAPTIGLSQLLKPYPQFPGITVVGNGGWSRYNSLQASIQRRFSYGFTFMAHWTWSKDMEALQYRNAMDPQPYYTISPNDRTHHIAINGIYELPFGPGKRFAGGTTGLPRKLVEGWQLISIYNFQSGQPLGFGDYILTGSQDSIVLSGSQRTVSRWFNTSAFDRSPADQLASELVQQPLLFSGIRGPRESMLDVSLVKQTKIRERLTAEIRAECFNFLNHPWFSNPNTTPTSTAFGTITSTNGNLPRTIQFGFVGRF